MFVNKVTNEQLSINASRTSKLANWITYEIALTLWIGAWTKFESDLWDRTKLMSNMITTSKTALAKRISAEGKLILPRVVAVSLKQVANTNHSAVII